MQNNYTLEIYNETRTELPEVALSDLKNKILGKDFSLTVSVLEAKNSKKINWKVRKQKYVPNTLSLKYSKTSGEIILTPEVIKKETYELNGKKISKLTDKVTYLLIHSLLHLTDLDHGPKMEKQEEKYFKTNKKVNVI